MHDLIDQMRALAVRHARRDRYDTVVPGLSVFTAGGPTELTPGVYEPMLCLVLQGAKEVLIGERLLRYDPHGYFIASLEMPACGRIVEASPQRPYVAMSIRLPPEELADLLPARDERAGEAPASSAFGVSPVTHALLDPCRRLLDLLDAPQDVPVIAPMLRREILYRLLQGPQGEVLRQIAWADSRLSRVRRAIGWIREHYDRPLRVEDLAAIAGMSPASFHRHFKTATAMSPLQFQKTLRLQQARRLLLSHTEVSRAGYAVGYESASQFSREYARAFGAPPARDAQRLRGDPALARAEA